MLRIQRHHSPTNPDAQSSSALVVLPGMPLRPSVVPAPPGASRAVPVPEPVRGPRPEPAAPTAAAAEVVVPRVEPLQVVLAGPAEGWYLDPSGRHRHRYWDGAMWTDHTA